MTRNVKENGHSTLVDTTYRRIKSDINERFLLPGDKIKLKQLCERYSVSETPVKQALMLLVFEGLIENIPQKGMRVRNIDWEEWEEIFDIRLMIELFFMRDVITTVKHNASIRKTLEDNVNQSLTRMSDVTKLEQHQQCYQLDSDFHELYLKCTGNKKIVEVYQNLNTHVYSNYIFGRQSDERTLEGIKEHRQILDAILAQDEDALEKAIRLHNHNARTTVMLFLKIENISTHFFKS